MDFSGILKSAGVQFPSVFLPTKGIDMEKWAVIACDQFTSQPEYWEAVEKFVAGDPSTLNLILPEVYLEEEDLPLRIKNINKAMEVYEKKGYLKEYPPALVLLDRETPHVKSRKGILLLIDLEKYDYTSGSKSLVRATEMTLEERLPPRMEIRKDAPFELPHIKILIDDPDRLVIEPLFGLTPSMDVIYDFDLMFNGGHVKAYMTGDNKILEGVAKALYDLCLPGNFQKRYSLGDDVAPLLFAVGDGNHSLATAKAHWEKNKGHLPHDHPARYAMAEIINIHDDGIIFEPIHRVLFNVDADDVLVELRRYAGQMEGGNPQSQEIPYWSQEDRGCIYFKNPVKNIETATLDDFLNTYLKSNDRVRIDYIHGRDAFMSLAEKPGNLGFFLPPIHKDTLFKTVILDGVLPRKTFSMGEAVEKRYYIEMRKIK